VFTGIVEEVGRLRSAEQSGPTTRLEFEATVVLDGSRLGDSIAVNGCCLTLVDRAEGWWAADAVAETLARTNLGRLRPGDPVNLERPVRLADRLGGHLVQGHVDGVGTIRRRAPDLYVETPAPLLRYLVEKGSVTVDGTSLTVVAVLANGFEVAIIPHTAAATVLGTKVEGDAVNLEVDVIAKYAERLLAAGTATPYAGIPSGAAADGAAPGRAAAL
jgi:riboflavin synthase